MSSIETNYFGPEGSAALFPALAATVGLTSLALNGNDFSRAGAEALSRVLPIFTGLVSLW